MPSKKKAPARKKAPRTAAKTMAARRADYGQPVHAYFAKKDRPHYEVVQALRKIVEEAVPDAVAALKWGTPVYAVGGRNFAAIGGHKAHVNLVLWGEPDTFDDPKGLLVGEGPSGRVLRLTHISQLPRAEALRFVKAAARHAREKVNR
jgi:hypothetical protein